jgi:putative chitinase
MPRYGIVTELQVAAFLATIVFESGYLRYTAEIRATKPGKIKSLQDKYWDSDFYGRGLIQLTKEPNYRAFAAHLKGLIIADAAINGNQAKVYPNPVVFPDSVATPELAVISACWYWQEHGLNKYADKGQFFAIQGLVNRGNAKKQAIDYPNREKLFNLALRILPDDFSFAPLAPAPDGAADPAPRTLSEPASNLPSETPASAPSFFTRASDWGTSAKAKWDQMNIDPNVLSGSSRVTTILAKFAGYLGLFLGWLKDNPVYAAIGLALVVAGIWYLNSARNRMSQARTFVAAGAAQTTVNVTQ